MKKWAFCSFFLLAAIISLPAQDRSTTAVTIVNKTGYGAYYLYISPSETETWGEDQLGDDILSDGASYGLRLPFSTLRVNRYNIRLEDEDGDTYTKMNIAIRPNIQIEFTPDDMDGRKNQSSAEPNSQELASTEFLIGGVAAKAAEQLLEHIVTRTPGKLFIAFFVSAPAKELAEDLAKEIASGTRLLKDKYRLALDFMVFANLHGPDEPTDADALNYGRELLYGKVKGANVIITGTLSGKGAERRLRLRALDTQGREIKMLESERI